MRHVRARLKSAWVRRPWDPTIVLQKVPEVSDTVTVTRGLNDEGSRLRIMVSIANAQISKAFVELIEERCAVFVVDVPWNPGEERP